MEERGSVMNGREGISNECKREDQYWIEERGSVMNGRERISNEWKRGSVLNGRERNRMNGLDRMDRRLLACSVKLMNTSLMHKDEWIQFNKQRWMIKE